MKNKIVLEFESKRWYRVVKSLYIIVFILLMTVANLAIILFSLDDNTFYFWPFIITNAIIVFGMGIFEGLFWYIVRGKWGYPKNATTD